MGAFRRERDTHRGGGIQRSERGDKRGYQTTPTCALGEHVASVGTQVARWAVTCTIQCYSWGQVIVLNIYPKPNFNMRTSARTEVLTWLASAMSERDGRRGARYARLRARRLEGWLHA